MCINGNEMPDMRNEDDLEIVVFGLVKYRY